jgi:hypothetical protein
MGIHIEVKRIKFPDGQYIARFKGVVSEDVNKEILPLVSLARKPDHCYFRIDLLQEHDHHAPPYQSKEDVDGYIQRVITDIGVALEKVGLELGKGTVEDKKVVAMPQTMDENSDN